MNPGDDDRADEGISRQRAGPVLLVVAAAVAWFQLDGVPVAVRAWTVLLLIAIPALMVMQGRALMQVDTLPRTQAYVSSVVGLWLLAIVTIVVAWVSGYGRVELGLGGAVINATTMIALSAALTAAGIAILFLFRFAGVREPPIVHELMPVTRTERLLFVGVSVTAGVCEEIVFRGFLIHVLHVATGSITLALVLSSGAFGVAHAYQQPAGALRAALLGLVLAAPLVLYGTIVPSIIAHAAIDIISGLWLSRRLLRD